MTLADGVEFKGDHCDIGDIDHDKWFNKFIAEEFGDDFKLDRCYKCDAALHEFKCFFCQKTTKISLGHSRHDQEEAYRLESLMDLQSTVGGTETNKIRNKHCSKIGLCSDSKKQHKLTGFLVKTVRFSKKNKSNVSKPNRVRGYHFSFFKA
jgi:hypothetical protein